MRSVTPHGPLCRGCTPVQPSLHAFSYVTPSTPHTGAKSAEHVALLQPSAWWEHVRNMVTQFLVSHGMPLFP